MGTGKKIKVIVVAGPTAGGKTRLGIEIAKAVNGEIISADSMQVYKGMSIATAAPTAGERAQVPHRMAEFLNRNENFSVSDFCSLAKKEIEDIVSLGKTPVIVGGTGLFIDSLIDNIRFSEAQTDFKLRSRLMEKDTDELYSELMKIDKAAAEKIHKNNKIRIVRALEIYYSSGKTKSQQDSESKDEETPYEALYFVIDYKNRELLYDRINRRVEIMMNSGLLDEARQCLYSDSGTSAQAIGHKELLPYFNGEIPLETAAENLKKETRRYAKRQITWFKRRKHAVHLFADELGMEKLAETAIDKSREFING